MDPSLGVEVSLSAGISVLLTKTTAIDTKSGRKYD